MDATALPSAPRSGFNALASTASAGAALSKIKYTHDAMIDLMLADPTLSQAAIASHFGYQQAWVSRIMNSDAFQARLAMRKGELVDPTLVATIEERFRAVAAKSLDVVLDKLHTNPTLEGALKAVDVVSKALGYGAKPQINIQNNIIDPKSLSDAEIEERLRKFDQVPPPPATPVDNIVTLVPKAERPELSPHPATNA